MKEFLIDLFTWKGRWNRLKFWIYPLVSLVIIIPILGIIAFISLEGYSEDARNSKIVSDISSISMKIQIESTMGKDIQSFQGEDNKINFTVLGENEEYFKNPNGSDYLIFTKGNMYQIYGETSNGIIIKGNYYQENENDPVSLVNIDGTYLQNGDSINNGLSKNNSGKNNSFILILSIITGIMYILVIWISLGAYIKRLHDLDKSGWWVLVNIIPFVSIGLLIYCGFFKGTEGNNRFGLNPLSKSSNDSQVIKNNTEL